MAAVSVVPEALALAQNGATAMHDVTRGGLLETLLEIAPLSSVGIEVDYDRLPVPAIVARLADAFQFDPLRMISSGTLAVTLPPERLEAMRAALTALGVPFAHVGQIVADEGVHIRRAGQVTRYTEIQCEEDELARMWALHPRD
jgi:hydrogenase expression/formation protein HypE